MTPPYRKKSVLAVIAATARLRCPVCLEGRVFKGLLSMHERCPVCAHQFERESGYFLGAMVISYTLAIPIIAAGAIVTWTIWPPLGVEFAFLVGSVIYLLFIPAVFRYSRVIWMQIDTIFDPPPPL